MGNLLNRAKPHRREERWQAAELARKQRFLKELESTLSTTERMQNVTDWQDGFKVVLAYTGTHRSEAKRRRWQAILPCTIESTSECDTIYVYYADAIPSSYRKDRYYGQWGDLWSIIALCVLLMIVYYIIYSVKPYRYPNPNRIFRWLFAAAASPSVAE